MSGEEGKLVDYSALWGDSGASAVGAVPTKELSAEDLETLGLGRDWPNGFGQMMRVHLAAALVIKSPRDEQAKANLAAEVAKLTGFARWRGEYWLMARASQVQRDALMRAELMVLREDVAALRDRVAKLEGGGS